jgi:multidrug efflux pump subunit AcrA (membrane-fusion protein)
MPALREYGQVRVRLPDGKTLDIRDITIYPVADSGSSSFRVRVDLPEGTGPLFPGMFVKVSLIVGEKEVLVIPRSAVVHRSEVTGTYVLAKNGKVDFRQIRVGRALGDEVVVLSGLEAGERTAVDPYSAVVTLKRGTLAHADD